MEPNKTERGDWNRLLEVMHRLRQPGGCPWDREQTHRSLIPCLSEEAAELTEALIGNDDRLLIEELGDVLLQVVFHAEIAEEEGRFGIDEVIRALIDKLIFRHPHVFGEGERLGSAGEVVTRWEEIKKGEKEKADRKSAMDGIPLPLPALQYAAKVQSRAAKTGFDWPDTDGVYAKLQEEIEEVIEAAGEAAAEAEEGPLTLRLEEEIGDLLFTVVNLSRHLKIAPEQALQTANRKFIGRFREMERLGAPLNKRSFEELDLLWNRVKNGSGSEGASTGNRG